MARKRRCPSRRRIVRGLIKRMLCRWRRGFDLLVPAAQKVFHQLFAALEIEIAVSGRLFTVFAAREGADIGAGHREWGGAIPVFSVADESWMIRHYQDAPLGEGL